MFVSSSLLGTCRSWAQVHPLAGTSVVCPLNGLQSGALMLSMMSGAYVPDSVYTKLPVRSEVEDQRPLRIVGGECLESRLRAHWAASTKEDGCWRSRDVSSSRFSSPPNRMTVTSVVPACEMALPLHGMPVSLRFCALLVVTRNPFASSCRLSI